MAFAVPHTLANDTTLDAEKLDQNFEAVENLLNGRLTDNHLSTSTKMNPPQFAEREFLFHLPMHVTQAQLAAATEGDIIAVTPFYDGLGRTYRIVGIAWAASDIGGNSLLVDLLWGREISGSWDTTTEVTIFKSLQIIDDQSAADEPGQGHLLFNQRITARPDKPLFAMRLTLDDSTALTPALHANLKLNLIMKADFGDYT